MENNPSPQQPARSVDPPDPLGKTDDPPPGSNAADRELVVDDETHRTLKRLSEDIDRFIDSIFDVSNKVYSPAPQIPDSVETYTKMVETELETNGSISAPGDSVLVDSVGRLGRLNTLLGGFSPGEKTASWLSRSSVVLQKAMMVLEDELRNILEEFANDQGCVASSSAESPSEKTPKTTKHFSSFHNHLHRRQESDSSSNHNHHRSNSTTALEPVELYPVEEDMFPAIPDETVAQMRAIANAMAASGYDTECCQVYSVLRRNAFKSAMKGRGFRKMSIDEIGKMSWEQLESQIATWNRVVRHTARILYPREYSLCGEVFSDYPSTGEGIMTNLAKSVVILFLNFAEGIAMTKRAAERLFKVLEIYESLTELGSAMEESKLPKEAGNELQLEISSVQRRLGEAVFAIFSDLKDSIKNDPAKNTVSGGAVHPLTRYTMNYLRHACNFSYSLETIFQKAEGEKSGKSKSPFSAELMRIFALLDTNLDAKSKQYKDASLRCVFLMNNGRFILQKIKEASEMHELVGRVASRKRSTELRAHHKSYQRETWSKVLQCLSHDGLQVNGKVHKPILKDRFKSFNQLLDEIHKTQSGWVVSDEQLQSELRVSVSSVMIPAYRSFVARFGQYFTPGRQVEKYIKYQPEDIEATIEELFDGNPNSVGKTKKGVL